MAPDSPYRVRDDLPIPSPGATTAHVRLFGRFVVVRGGDEVPVASFGGRKVRTLLRILMTRRPGLVATDVLTQALWPDGTGRPGHDLLAVLGRRAGRSPRLP